MTDVQLQAHVLDGWHQRQPPWRIVQQDYVMEPDVEDDGVIRVTRPGRVATFTWVLERLDDAGHPVRQTITASGYVMVTDPPTLLVAFPLEP